MLDDAASGKPGKTCLTCYLCMAVVTDDSCCATRSMHMPHELTTWLCQSQSSEHSRTGLRPDACCDCCNAEVILKRVRDAQHTEAEINSAREKYRVVPRRGSILYFVIADMPLLDPMYQYSLEYFIQIFNHCIRTAPKHRDLSTRLKTLLDVITETVFNTVSRSDIHIPALPPISAAHSEHSATRMPHFYVFCYPSCITPVTVKCCVVGDTVTPTGHWT